MDNHITTQHYGDECVAVALQVTNKACDTYTDTHG